MADSTLTYFQPPGTKAGGVTLLDSQSRLDGEPSVCRNPGDRLGKPPGGAGIAHGCNDLQPGTAGAKTTRGMANTRMASRWKSVPLLIVLTLSVPPALAATPTTDPSHACCTKVSPHHTEKSAPACCRIPEAIPGAPAAPVPKLATHARLAIAAIPCETPWAAGAHQPLVPVPPGKHTGYAVASLNTVLRC